MKTKEIKFKLVITFLLVFSLTSYSQVSISDLPDKEADPSAVLDLFSEGKGFLLPRIDDTEARDAIAVDSEAESLMIFNKETKCFEVFIADDWHELWCADYEAPECGEDIEFEYPAGSGVSVTYGTVEGQNGSCWMDRNLGADRVAESSTDYEAYGDLFQWGRLDDGHQLIEWTNSTSGSSVHGATGDLSNSDVPGHNDFIGNSESPFDWRVPQNHELWQDDNGSILNNPCPDGWRVPTQQEWESEIDEGNWNNAEDAFNSSLKLTKAGRRMFGNANLFNTGVDGWYWSNSIGTIINIRSKYLLIDDSEASSNEEHRRAYGASVRCIKN